MKEETDIMGQRTNVNLKDIIYLLSLVGCIAVTWGMTSAKIEFLEKTVEQKADKEVINTKLDYIAEKVTNIEEKIEEMRK